MAVRAQPQNEVTQHLLDNWTSTDQAGLGQFDWAVVLFWPNGSMVWISK